MEHLLTFVLILRVSNILVTTFNSLITCCTLPELNVTFVSPAHSETATPLSFCLLGVSVLQMLSDDTSYQAVPGDCCQDGASPGLRIPVNFCEASVVETTVCSEPAFLVC